MQVGVGVEGGPEASVCFGVHQNSGYITGVGAPGHGRSHKTDAVMLLSQT